MKDFRGKNAFITGAGAGIGLGIARAFAREGVNMALADIRGDAVERAAAELAGTGVKTFALQLDISDRAAVYDAADRVEAAFGKVHIVVNNAGVGYQFVPLEETPDGDLDWVFAVNTFGVLNGIKAFVPKLRKHGEGGYIVNTASLSGLHVMPGWHHGLYSASKMGVIALSYGLRETMAPHGIEVSVLCPAVVDTDIHMARRVRPARFGGSEERPERVAAAIMKKGLPPDSVGPFVVRGMLDGEFFLFPNPEARRHVETWQRGIMKGFDYSQKLAAELGLKSQ
jgi:NAD(P)-dependent dehydrogenase (short-subunit alcohol dehydrogenase family)